MTEQQRSPGLDPAEAYATEYRRLWDATVATLTAAVQLDHPQHGPVDFSDQVIYRAKDLKVGLFQADAAPGAAGAAGA